MIGDKKSIYHSELTRAGDVHVTIKSGILESKYKKRGEPGFNYIVLEHEGMDQTYTIENDACAQAFNGRKGESVTIRATGAREDARIEILNTDGTVKPQAAPKAPHEPQKREKVSPEDAAAKAMVGMLLSLDTAVKTKAAFELAHSVQMSDAQFQAITSTIFINLDKQGLIQ